METHLTHETSQNERKGIISIDFSLSKTSQQPPRH